MYQAKNAIIMAAGTSSRFAPLSYELHKGLIEVNGEILVERQIKQLKESGINDIIIVTGYKAEQFEYLKDKFSIKLVHNPNYLERNNNSSIYAVREYIDNSYICSVDNYFVENPFTKEVEDSYYAAIFSEGPTNEWCISEDNYGYINSVNIGGENSWIMLGHTFWAKDFADKFLGILDAIYDNPETTSLLWENIYMQNLNILKMKIQKYSKDSIFEFDTLDELRAFDKSYINDSRSTILKKIAKELGVKESNIVNVNSVKGDTNESIGVEFTIDNVKYQYNYNTKKITFEGDKNVRTN